MSVRLAAYASSLSAKAVLFCVVREVELICGPFVRVTKYNKQTQTTFISKIHLSIVVIGNTKLIVINLASVRALNLIHETVILTKALISEESLVIF